MLNITRANLCTKAVSFIISTVIFCLTSVFSLPLGQAWEVDFSRRRSREAVERSPAAITDQTFETSGADRLAENSLTNENPPKKVPFLEWISSPTQPIQDIVVIHTERGFLPAQIHLKAGGRYDLSVVNISEKEKNVSFVLDAFSEHHAIYFGKLRQFRLEPRREGVFEFQSPETGATGRIVVSGNVQLSPQNLKAPSRPVPPLAVIPSEVPAQFAAPSNASSQSIVVESRDLLPVRKTEAKPVTPPETITPAVTVTPAVTKSDKKEESTIRGPASEEQQEAHNETHKEE